MDPVGACLDRRDGAGGREAEVVVPVVVERHVRPHGVTNVLDEVRDGLGSRDAERVDHDDLGCAGSYRRAVHVRDERQVGTGPVDSEERDLDAGVRGVRHSALDAFDHFRARDTERSQLQVGHGRLDDRRAMAASAYQHHARHRYSSPIRVRMFASSSNCPMSIHDFSDTG